MRRQRDKPKPNLIYEFLVISKRQKEIWLTIATEAYLGQEHD